MIMYVQAVASLGIWVVQLLTISERLKHNQDVDGSVWFVIVANPVITALVALAAVFLTRRSWARGLGGCLQVVGVIGALASVITGYYQAGVAIVLAIAAMVLLASGSPRSAHTARGISTQ
ncbi:hypothetical protein [Kutzneria sp. NPDC052558]|uniref:hypothetical protein n=1 Tax=Kutzneria sp. NPDC052558 TaxID=3364121 RepID=UPI0037C6D2BF